VDQTAVYVFHRGASVWQVSPGCVDKFIISIHRNNVAMCDGCRRDDVVVGAPFYHQSGVGGAIYIYMNGPEVRLCVNCLKCCHFSL